MIVAEAATAASSPTAARRSTTSSARSALDLDVGEAAEEVDTLGGLVVTLAGRVPVRGEIVAGPGRLSSSRSSTPIRAGSSACASAAAAARRRSSRAGGDGERPPTRSRLAA